MKKIAVMQPYIFPYLGYFQLIAATDLFVFYDDVNFIKRGWVNRNRILINGNPSYFTVFLQGASQNKLIKEVEILDNRKKLISTISMAYKKAPFFQESFPLIEDVLTHNTKYISDLAMYSIKQTCSYLGINTKFDISSKNHSETQSFDRTERLVAICKKMQGVTYINLPGGRELYKKEDFEKNGINLFFIKNSLPNYQQFKNDFVPGLSIIDVMMFNSKDEIRNMLNEFELE